MESAVDRIVRAYMSKQRLNARQELFLRDEIAAFIVQLRAQQALKESNVNVRRLG
jgi:hypothetical protein